VCLGIPMRLVQVQGSVGTAAMDGVARTVMLDLVPGAAVGDYVIVHAGYAIQTLDQKEAEETLALLADALGGDR
jgi:hydrogenase expression/formation protein HypC